MLKLFCIWYPRLFWSTEAFWMVPRVAKGGSIYCGGVLDAGRTGSTRRVNGESWVKGGVSDTFAKVLATLASKPVLQPVSSRSRKGPPNLYLK